MTRKSRTMLGARIKKEEKTTIPISRDVKNVLDRLTSYFDYKYMEKTDIKLGLIVNDSLKILINFCDGDKLELPFKLPEFDLDFKELFDDDTKEKKD